MKTMKLGKIESIRLRLCDAEINQGTLTIDKETGKAIQLKFQGLHEFREYDENAKGEITWGKIVDEDCRVENFITKFWIPKSACKIENNHIEVADWLWKKNGLFNFTDGQF